MALPIKIPLPLMQTIWKSQLDPILANPILSGRLLEDIMLTHNTINSVNHGLQRKLIGWFIVGIDKGVFVWDAQASNQTPELTLALLTDSPHPVTVNLWVF